MPDFQATPRRLPMLDEAFVCGLGPVVGAAPCGGDRTR